MRRAIHYIGYVIANGLAGLVIFYLLWLAHVYVNGLVIPNGIRWQENRLRTHLTHWYVVALLLLGVELLSLLQGLYRFNRWYVYPGSGRNGSGLAFVTTGIVGVLVSLGMLFVLFGA